MPRYNVRTSTLRTLWKRSLHERRVDWLKVDIDQPWSGLGVSLESLLAGKRVGVMSLEVDGSWGGVLAHARASPRDAKGILAAIDARGEE